MQTKSMKTWSRIVALIFFVACVPPEPRNIGEFPIGLSSLGDTAGLVTYFIPEPNGSKIGEFRLLEVKPDGTVFPLSVTYASFEIRYSDAAVAITRSADKIEAFILTSFHAISINREHSFLRQLDDMPFLHRNFTPSIGVLKREKERNWVWVTSGKLSARELQPPAYAVDGTEGTYKRRPGPLPLIEFEGGEINVIADNVMWAHCGADWCQQLRFESGTARLYASPVTSDLYLRPVTESTLEFTDTYQTCRIDSSNRSVLQIGEDYFALSQTEPAMHHFSGFSELVEAIPEAQSCSVFEGETVGNFRHRESSRHFRTKFSDGRGVTASAKFARKQKEVGCGSATLEPFDSCGILAHIFETKLEFHDESEAVTTAFPVHDLK